MKRVFAFIGFSVAITLIMLNLLSFSWSGYVLLAVAVMFLISLLVRKTRQAKVLPVVLGSSIFACLIFIVFTQATVMPQKDLVGESLNVQFRIVDNYNVSKSGNYNYTAKTSFIDKNNSVQNIKVNLISRSKIECDYYDDISGKIKFIDFEENVFDSYGKCGEGIFLTGYLENYNVIDSGNVKPVYYYLISLRKNVSKCIESGIGGDNGAIATALLTGDKSNISSDLKNNFNVSGVSHSLAVSGLHVGIIYLALKFLLAPLNNRRILQGIITITLLLGYMGLVGFSKSVLRAGIMLIILITAKIINKRADTLNSLGLATFIICLNPYAVTDPSAVLTVSAVVGMVTIYNEFSKHLTVKNKFLQKIIYGILMSFSIFLSTLPACYIFFKNISITSIFVNVIFIPFVQIAVISTFIYVVFSKITILAFLPKVVTNFSTFLMIKISEILSSKFSFLYVDVSDTFFAFAIASLFLILGIMLIVDKRISLKVISVFIALVFCFSTVIGIYQANTKAYVKVLSTGAIFVFDNENVVALDVDNTQEMNYFEQLVNRRKSGILVNCENISLDNSNTVLIDGDFSGNVPVDEKVSLSVCDNGEIFIRVFQYDFKIDENYVTILGNRVYRNIGDKFNEEVDYVFEVKDNSQIVMKEC